MKLVMTLAVSGHADLVDAHVAFHLNAGVDFVIASAEALDEKTEEVLASFARADRLRLLPPTEPHTQTRMIRLAATEHGADWVINSSADEFWWPRAENLKAVLAPIPERYTVVQALCRELVPASDSDEFFAERMILRRSTTKLRPIHRADPKAVVQLDGTVDVTRPMPLRAWYPIEVFHLRTDDEERTKAELSDDSRVVDTRLRDALRTLREHAFALPADGRSVLTFPAPDIVDDAAYAVDCAAVREVDLSRLEQHVVELEQRIAWLEQRFWPRALRLISRLVGRRRG